MIKVKNRKAIRNIADKSFWANKTRNLIAIIAIALTSILFTTIFTMGIGTVQTMQKALMRQAGGDGHAALKYITDDEYGKIKNHYLIKEISYCRALCDSVDNEVFQKRKAEFWYYDDVGMKLGFIELAGGHKPVKKDEIITDTKTLQLLGVPLKEGAPLTLKLNIRGKTVERKFILSGWWESDPVFNVGQIIASRAYVDSHLDELQNTHKKDFSLTGAINAYIMFDNSFNLGGKLKTVLIDSGYSMDETAPNYIESNVNWSYLSTNFGMDAGTLTALISGLVLIVLTGYLIIYNIFQISVIKDIRFYGLLKTIGTTRRQIRRIIKRQALFLSIIGIPIGLSIGFFIGKSIVPLIMDQSSYSGTHVSVTPDPWIFVGSALFAFFTVIISIFKPGRIAASVSPVEAVRFTGGNIKYGKKLKKSTGGAKMYRMAFSNLGRNKKRTIFVVISLSLSIVLLNTVFTLSNSIDMDKYLGKFNDTDFLIAHSAYFQNHFKGPENQLTESFIEAVSKQSGFKEGGRLYGGEKELFAVEDRNNTTQKYNLNVYGHQLAMAYGLEDLPLQRLELIDGELDFKKLASGKYILEGIHLDDNNVPMMDSAHFKVGEKITLHNYKGTSDKLEDMEYTTHQYTVLGHVAIKTYSNSNRCSWNYTFYFPADVFKTLVAQPTVMSYAFNVSKEYLPEVENYLKNYTNSVEPTMNYTSKLSSADSFYSMRNTVVMIGGVLSLIIGLIGILNFINSILTGIITRQKEFAMLSSIGMTKKQLRRMLCYEGLYYITGTCVISLILSIIFSLLIVKFLCQLIWFLSYNFIIWPVLAVLPILLLFGAAIPFIIFVMTDRQSIVERLRYAD